jgi:drug/metabolite transporter (DMT)-like permease
VVAVLIGYFLGGEALGLRTIVGSLCVLISVVGITLPQTRKAVARNEEGSREGGAHGPAIRGDG